MKLYNTRTRKKQLFKPLKDDMVRMYCCGPTVYDYAHIGNLRTYLFEDVLRRVLEYNGFKVKHVMNLTDVGHLTSDADVGEDKVMKALRREGKKPSVKAMLELTEHYTKAFFQDTEDLNIIKPGITPKATEHVQEMIDLIRRIDDNGYAYKTSVGLMFDTSEFSDYADFANLNLEEQKAGARVEVDKDKRRPWDFALWVTNQPSHVMQWESPWGKGFPGWHIECAAMSIAYLGEQFDIHCGGEDHIPVHHTNEIAQAEAATGKKPWVNFWLHGAFLVLKKEKMSKSAGGFITLKTVKDKGFDPLAYRYLHLTSHYRSKLSFDWSILENAQRSFESFKHKLGLLKAKPGEGVSKGKKEDYLKKFKDFVNDDLDTPKALALAWDVLKAKDLSNEEKISLILEFDKVFGLKLDEVEPIKTFTADVLLQDTSTKSFTADAIIAPPKKVIKLLEKRKKARDKKKWEESDAIRAKLKGMGWLVEDTSKGQVVRRA